MTEFQGTTPVHTNVYAGGRLLATYSNANIYFPFTDWLGTKRAEIANNCSSTYASLPYGDELTPHGTCPDATEHHYTGKERDTESTNDYFGARYYASTAGRFVSPDWSAKAQAVPYATYTDPQSLNLYEFVGNNPIARVDTNGHYCDVEYNSTHCGDSLAQQFGQSLRASFDSELVASFLQEGEEDIDEALESIREKNALQRVDNASDIEQPGRCPGCIHPGEGEKGPLNDTDARNFSWYVPVKLEHDATYYRQWGGEAELEGKGSGTYYSLFPPAGSTDFMRNQMSISPQWNTMKNIDEVTIPAGTVVYAGPAAPQGGFTGGGIQVFVPKVPLS